MQSEKSIDATTSGSEISVNPKLRQEWLELLEDEFRQDYFLDIKKTLLQERSAGVTHYPPSSLIFSALEACAPADVKVVILGQDPYHNPGEAHGLCFSVPEGVRIPPSLLNIYKEINRDLGLPVPSHGNLESWAKQGVLMLNASLTVRAHQAGSHSAIGWHQFTDTIIQTLSEKYQNIVFLLWGAHARKKKQIIATNQGHLILEAPHPSPLSAHRGFLGCGHFRAANEYLESVGRVGVEWSV